ncbi:MAG TPA: hypothetical protein VMF61_10610 [Candidatus Acidoferrales bacterium]|nr:hypothetical protein [Candidatus Acidoferrales bacterium]
MRLTAITLIAMLFGTVAIALPASPVTPTARDGRDDFNFLLGHWHTHYRVLRDRLAGSHTWDDCDGTSIVTPFWNDSGNLEVGDLHCPPPRGYVEGITLRTYSAATHQWSLYWGTKKTGLAMPPQVGHFNADGIGDFYDNETFRGRPIVVRYRWRLLHGLPHFEQAYSADAEQSWETNWICDYTRA